MNNYMKTIISGLKQWVSSQKPDWKQNDSSAANYVKNRTHYEEEKLTQVLKVEEYAYSSGYSLENNITLSLDTVYKVVLNGEVYECISDGYVDGQSSSIGVGNYMLVGGDKETGEPFRIQCEIYNGDYTSCGIFFKEHATVHTVSLYSVVNGIETAIFENIECDIRDSMANMYDNCTDLVISEEGKKYTVIFDGETFECVSKYYPDWEVYFIGRSPDTLQETKVPFCILSCTYEDDYETYIETSIHTISTGYHKITVLENTPFVHKLDAKYLPDDLVFDNQVYTKDDVYNKDEIYKNGEATFTITWDGNIEEKDKFTFNSSLFYKISDVVPDFNAITYGESLFSDGGFRNGFLYEGVNCYRAAYAVIVTQAGLCELAPIPEEGYQRFSFTAPSTGIYFYHSDYSNQTKMTLLLRNVEKHGIYLNSALAKNFVIGVTDEGALTTEDSNGVIVEMATTDGIVEQISDAVSSKMDKVTGGTNGNFIKLDANGNAVDSGQNTNSFVPMTSLNTFIAPHITNTKVHITEDERTAWNAKSNFSGDYNDLTNIPTTVRLVDDVTSTVYELGVSNGKLTLSEVNE